MWRRLQKWEELKPYVIQIIKAVGLGKCDMTSDREWKSERLIANVSRRRIDSVPSTPHAQTACCSVVNEPRR